MDQGPLVIEQIEAGARFLAEFQKYLQVRVAFWLKESDEGEWNLYIVSDGVTDDNLDVAYGEVLRIAGEIQDLWFDPFQVKLIGENDALAKAVMDLHRGYPGRNPTRFRGKTLGGVSVDELYIYPLPINAQGA